MNQSFRLNYQFIPGYEGIYAINPKGEVKRVSRTIVDTKGRLYCFDQQFVKNRIDKRTGYLVVKLTRPNGSYGTQFVHRLLALTFLPNPENKPMINHKNGNKLDNRLHNLEWVTAAENMNHAVKVQLIRPFHKTQVVNICSGETFGSIKEAALATKIPYNKLKELIKDHRQDSCFRRA